MIDMTTPRRHSMNSIGYWFEPAWITSWPSECLMHHGTDSKYIRNMLTENISVKFKNLCSSKAKLYIVPFVKNETYAARSLSVARPYIWNNLPVDIISETQLDAFKIKLKHLFNNYFKECM